MCLVLPVKLLIIFHASRLECVTSMLYGRFGSVVKWLEQRDYERHGLGSKPTRAVLLCPSERQFAAHSSA